MRSYLEMHGVGTKAKTVGGWDRDIFHAVFSPGEQRKGGGTEEWGEIDQLMGSETNVLGGMQTRRIPFVSEGKNNTPEY